MKRLTITIAIIYLHFINANVIWPTQSTWAYTGHVTVKNVATDETKPLASIWTISSNVTFQRFDGYTIMKLNDVSTKIYNGEASKEENSLEKEIPDDAAAILKPIVIYTREKSNYTITHEPDDPIWSVNMKRAIINSMINNNEAFESKTERQQSLYGDCDTSYTVEKKENGIFVEKKIDHDSCENSPGYDLSNKDWDPTVNNHKPFVVETKYFYTYNKNNILKKVDTISTLTYQSMSGVRSVQKAVQTKSLTKILSTDTFDKIDTSKNTIPAKIIFDFSSGVEGDRDKNEPKKSQQELINSFDENYDIFKKEFQSPTLKNFDVNSNDSATRMFDALYEMKKEDIDKFSAKVFEKKDELYQHMFLSFLPYLGTFDSMKFIKNLIEKDDENLNDLLAIKILSMFPVYAEEYSKELIEEMEPLMRLKTVKNIQVTYAGILSYASLLAEALKSGAIEKSVHRKYARLYFKKFNDAKDYEMKMIYWLGMINIGGSYSEDILDLLTDSNISHHLRALGIHGFQKHLKSKSFETFEHFWPLVKNQSEHYEVRTAALDTLLHMELQDDQFKSIINWYKQNLEKPKEQHLTHYLYTTLQALENSTGYHEHLGALATEALNTLPSPTSTHLWSNGNYRMAFTDADNNYGGCLQMRLISNPISNVISTGIFSMDAFALSLNLGAYKVYLKLDGVLEQAFMELVLRRDSIDSIPELLQIIQTHGYKIKDSKDAHIEVVIFCDDRVVFGIHINKNNIDNYSDNPLFLDLLKLIINYNTLSYPLMDYTYMVSDLGTGIKISNDITEISSYELDNFNTIFLSNDSDEDTIEYSLKYRSMWDYCVDFESYNPLIGANIGTYKYVRDEKLVNIPYSFNLTDYVFKWRHTKDSFNWVRDHLIGTYVDDAVKLEGYCSSNECPQIAEVDSGDSVQSGIIPDKLKLVLGVDFNMTSTTPSSELLYLDNMEPTRKNILIEVFKNHKSNTNCAALAKPLLLLWHVKMYNAFNRPELGKFSLRSKPFYNEPTETVLDLEFDSNDFTSDKDPIGGSEIDFSIALTNRKSHDATVLNYLNATVVYKTLPKAPDEQTQPHFEQNYELNVFYSQGDEKKYKVCLEREILYPNRRTDKYSFDTVDPTKAKTNILFGYVEKISDKCPENNSLSLTEIYEASEQQTQDLEAMEEFVKCKKQSKGLKYVPPTKECLSSHREISRYDVCTIYIDFSKIDGVPEEVLNISSEYGVKSFTFHRLNYTHAALSVTNDLYDSLFDNIKFKEEEMQQKIVVLDPTELLSIDPAEIAYEDEDVKVGFSSVCHITPQEIITFHGEVITSFEADAVAFVECLNNSQRGLSIQKLGDNSLGFKFYSEDNVLVASNSNGKLKIVYNGEEKKSVTDIKNEDFKIYFLDSDVLYVTNGLVDIQYTTEYISIKTYYIYNNYICGLCSGDQK